MKRNAIIIILILFPIITISQNKDVIIRYAGNINKISKDNGQTWNKIENTKHYKIIRNGITKVTSDMGQTWKIIYTRNNIVKFTDSIVNRHNISGERHGNLKVIN